MQYRIALFLCLLCLSNAPHAERAAFTLPNGDRYEGDIVDGALSGNGVYEWVDGDRYEGQFSNDLPNGAGRYLWADGRRYDGEFVAGERQGYGSLIWVSGDRYEGAFLANQMHGEGTFFWGNGDRYEGSFMGNQRHGAGSMLWRSGQRYEGGFADDTMHGQGIYRWPDGRLFKGSFVGGKRTGTGIFASAEGTLFRGFFADDQRQGLVVKQLNSGDRFLEQYSAGTLVESLRIVADSRCQFSTPDGDWMVMADACINGLAHGSGNAVSLNGLALIEGGSWVLGKLVRGVVIALPSLALDIALTPVDNSPLWVSKALAND